ncbi:MAG: S1C family serine protease [Thermoplasmata archaeon]
MPLPGDDELIGAVERLRASVVGVERVVRRPGPSPHGAGAAGSGLVVDARGFVVTNAHVVGDRAPVEVELSDGRRLRAECVGVDRATDLALLRVDAGRLSAATLGDSGALRPGQLVLAVGNALGLPGAPTVSVGVVSATARPLPGSDLLFEGWIQTDAAINPGNSGGPLADRSGTVVGINTATIPSAQGMGFAIPVNTVRDVVDQLRAAGHVARAWLGISSVSAAEVVPSGAGERADGGVLVVEVAPGGPAWSAGLAAGDLIVAIGSTPVRHLRDLLQTLSGLPIGGRVDVEVVHDGRRVRRLVRLREAPPVAGPRR